MVETKRCPYRGFTQCYLKECPAYQGEKTPWCMFVEQKQTPRKIK
jgi:hypothetical protein